MDTILNPLTLKELFLFIWEKQHDRLLKDGVVSLQELLSREFFQGIFEEISFLTSQALVPEKCTYEVQPTRFVLTAVRSFVVISEEKKRCLVEEGEAGLLSYELDRDLDVSNDVAEETLWDILSLEDAFIKALERRKWREAKRLLGYMLEDREKIEDGERRTASLREAHAFALEMAALRGDIKNFIRELEICRSLGGPLPSEFLAPHTSRILETGFGLEGVDLRLSLLGRLRLRQLRQGGERDGLKGEKKIEKLFLEESLSVLTVRVNDAFARTVAVSEGLTGERMVYLFASLFTAVKQTFLAENPWIESAEPKFIS